MQQKQVCVVTYLNLDDSPESALQTWQVGDSPYILNVRTMMPGSAGKGSNVMGNTLIEYDLPAGINKIIGVIEDEQDNIALVFIQNSLGNHQIARYFSTGMEQLIESPLLDFSTEYVIHSASITNEMIYWTDNTNEPRKINMAKAITAFKLEEHELYFSPKENGTRREITITISRNAVVVVPVTILVGFLSTSSEVFCIDLANALNALTLPAATSPSTYFTFSGQNKHVKAVSKSPGDFVITISGVDIDLITSASTPIEYWDQIVNKYYPLTDNYIATLIRPPLFTRPTASYIEDSERNTNQVNNSLFQFTTRLRMDDFENTVFTGYSNTPIIPASCTGGNFNAILLDFDDPKLQSKEWLSVIRGVDICVRTISEGSDSYGPWKLIETLFREDFVLNRTYKFYNDGSYTVISQADQERAYDAVPLQVETMESILSTTDYRGVLANGVEDFDSPEIALVITPTFEDANPVSGSTGTVRGGRISVAI